MVGWTAGQPDSRTAGRPDGEAGNRTSTAQLELRLGLSLAKTTGKKVTSNFEEGSEERKWHKGGGKVWQ